MQVSRIRQLPRQGGVSRIRQLPWHGGVSRIRQLPRQGGVSRIRQLPRQHHRTGWSYRPDHGGSGNGTLCPVAVMLQFLTIRPKEAGPLFIKQTNKHKGYSFQIGTATTTAASRVSEKTGHREHLYPARRTGKGILPTGVIIRYLTQNKLTSPRFLSTINLENLWGIVIRTH